MSMLADPKYKQKISVDPRNLHWKNDENKFGQKLMEKMGWTSGKGLGQREAGIIDPIQVSLKNDNRGVGCSKNEADNWIAHQDDFNNLLSSLGSQNGDEASNSDQDAGKVISLENKSKNSKGRVHYMKFTKGKDLSYKSAEDLDCVFGRRKNKSAPSTPVNGSQNNSEEDSNDSKEDTVTVDDSAFQTFNSGTSVQDYFAKKMAQRSSGSLKVEREAEDEAESRPGFGFSNNYMGSQAHVGFGFVSASQNSEETVNSFETIETTDDGEINSKKKKKKKKSKKEEKECDTAEESSNGGEKKKKSKQRKEDEENKEKDSEEKEMESENVEDSSSGREKKKKKKKRAHDEDLDADVGSGEMEEESNKRKKKKKTSKEEGRMSDSVQESQDDSERKRKKKRNSNDEDLECENKEESGENSSGEKRKKKKKKKESKRDRSPDSDGKEKVKNDRVVENDINEEENRVKKEIKEERKEEEESGEKEKKKMKKESTSQGIDCEGSTDSVGREKGKGEIKKEKEEEGTGESKGRSASIEMEKAKSVNNQTSEENEKEMAKDTKKRTREEGEGSDGTKPSKKRKMLESEGKNKMCQSVISTRTPSRENRAKTKRPYPKQVFKINDCGFKNSNIRELKGYGYQFGIEKTILNLRVEMLENYNIDPNNFHSDSINVSYELFCGKIMNSK